MNNKSNKRAEQARDTKNRIFSAALELFNQKGVQNVTITEIAQKANCSVGNLYHYFRNKEEIAAQSVEPLDEQYGAYAARLLHEPQYAAWTARQKFSDFFVEVHRISGQGPLLAASFIYSLNHPEDGLLRVDEKRQLWQVYQELLEGLIREGYLEPACDRGAIIQQLTILSRGLLLEWQVWDRQFDLPAQAQSLIETFLSGLLRQP